MKCVDPLTDMLAMLHYNYGNGIEIEADVLTVSIYENDELTDTVSVVPVQPETMPQPHITFLGYIFGGGDSAITEASATYALYIEWVGDGWAAYSNVVSEDDLYRNDRIRVDYFKHDREECFMLYDPQIGGHLGSPDIYSFHHDSILRWTDDYCSWFLVLCRQYENFYIDAIFAHGCVKYSFNVNELPEIPMPTPPLYLFRPWNDAIIGVEIADGTTDITEIYR